MLKQNVNPEKVASTHAKIKFCPLGDTALAFVCSQVKGPIRNNKHKQSHKVKTIPAILSQLENTPPWLHEERTV